jgi:uncharacterized protein YyaL (SSP411 family)
MTTATTDEPGTRTPDEIRRSGNHLKAERSLYLAQHAHNPIDWYPWAEEALERARNEDKPIFLSIGYASCHWCHVMERDVFESDDVALFMNEHFVCIKVDREERPDLDALYMDAVMALTGSGGWPMSVFLTPSLEPFHGGTTYTHDAFLVLARAIADAYVHRRDDVRGQAARLQEFITREPRLGQGGAVDQQRIEQAARGAIEDYDATWGGLGTSMKFPTPLTWTFLLHRYRRTGDERYGRMVRGTLDAMGSGGIHDHVAGGFHRYSVDRTWLVPHFEKMLYDNALLASLYTEAAIVFRDPRYEEIARSTLDFMIREMSDPGGGFFSSFDADSGGTEGAYYVWSPEEIVAVSGPDDGPPLAMLLGVTDRPSFGAGSIPTRRTAARDVAARFDREVDEVEKLLDTWIPELRAHRARRTPPRLDRKIITSWNGLAISAMAQGYRAFGQERYLAAARSAADFLHRVHRRADGRLMRSSNAAVAEHDGVLDDYAFLASGLLHLYQASMDEVHLERALILLEHVRRGFAHPVAGFTFAEAGPGRKVHLTDNARPSGNAEMLHAMLMASALTGNGEMRGIIDSTLEAYAGEMQRHGLAMAWWYDAADKASGPYYEIVIAGDPVDRATRSLVDAARGLHPSHAVLASVPAEGPGAEILELMPPLEGKRSLADAPTAYVCRLGSCKRPTPDADELRRQILEGWAL